MGGTGLGGPCPYGNGLGARGAPANGDGLGARGAYGDGLGARYNAMAQLEMNGQWVEELKRDNGAVPIFIL